VCWRHKIGNEFYNELVDLILAFLFEESAGDTDNYREHWNKRQQRSICQGRCPHWTTITGETASNRYPEVQKTFPFRSLAPMGESPLIQQRLGSGAHLLKLGKLF